MLALALWFASTDEQAYLEETAEIHGISQEVNALRESLETHLFAESAEESEESSPLASRAPD
jgi:hypothetical protein